MKNLGATLKTVWRIASPYFRSEDKWAGLGLLVIVIAIELGTVGVDVLLNEWRNRFFNAFQAYNWSAFASETIYFCVVVTIYIVIAVYQLYLNQWLQIRWRNWTTKRYLGDWLSHANHYRMQLQGDVADNPDQRITEDIRMFVEQTLTLGLGLLNSVVTLVSFIVILWGLSAAAPLHVFGHQYNIPGYLVWGALIYAIIGTVLTHLIGRPLIGLDYRQQQYEADFRFNLVRVRENSEQIALLRGEEAERTRLMDKFQLIVENWIGIMKRTKKITAFTASYGQATQIIPYILVAPAYFANKTKLGGVMQAASAFLSVQGALSFFVSAYRQLAEWRSIVTRLDGFEKAIAKAKALGAQADTVKISPADSDITLDELLVRLPNGKPLVSANGFRFRNKVRTLVVGPSGSGKSTLFRTIGGIWPFGAGSVAIPAHATMMIMPQQPYFPIGSLQAAIAYPAEAGAYDAQEIAATVTAVGLPALASRLDEEAHWDRMLSPGEQQRLGVARALLHRPDYLFLDEATTSLDEPSENALYRLIAEKLPATTIVSISHRNTLEAFHQDKVVLEPAGDRFAIHGVTEPANAT
ncbi:ABC transporter ATP-binding protein/permease [Nitrobacter sp. NHB1]|uniref:ABC transporter ATP-binding protein/permease n=1 Tax=Nitrobacter sp. NHB1 TaxID=3119830 RepID=UPI002FFF9B6E